MDLYHSAEVEFEVYHIIFVFILFIFNLFLILIYFMDNILINNILVFFNFFYSKYQCVMYKSNTCGVINELGAKINSISYGSFDQYLSRII